MHKAKSMVRNLAIAMVLWATAGTTLAITLSPFATNFNQPIGIDWYEPLSKLILSVNYPSGSPNNLDLVDLGTGVHVQYSSLVNLTNEVKVATVRSGACQSGFTVGEAFTGNGSAGQIVRIGAGGAPVLNSWVDLGAVGETALVRGSLFQDRFCAAGGDLIVVTGNEQEAGNPGGINSIGNVWRVTSGAAANCSTGCTNIATIGTHLEGVTTVPNDATLYGPLAGRIIAGAEEFDNAAGPPTYDVNGGKIYAIDPAGGNHWFTISAALATTCTPGAATPDHCNYNTANAFHPEDLDIIRGNADFFGVNYGVFPDGHVLTAAASDFNGLCGRVLITQEFPFAGTSGLTTLRWNSGTNSFIADPLAANTTISQWEHTTFTSGEDCFALKVEKSPKSGTFAYLGQATYTIVVTNTGALPDDISLTDALPGNGGLVWLNATPTQGSCTNPIVANNLSCNLGTVAAGASVTITVTSTATTPAAACQDQPNPAAIATDTHGNSAKDSGDLTCTVPPHLKVVKTPDGGTFSQGGAVSFTIVVSNDGGSDATNAKLSDQLPTNGGLDWSGASITVGQGSCSISAGSLLTCSFGTIAKGGSVTVTVSLTSTPAAACQSQPNPDAKATADGGLVADDAGSLTCTPPPAGLIAPTATTCQQFASGTASALGEIDYSLTGANKIAQGINPGVFFYYTKITVAANTTVTVSESQNDAAALFQIQQGQARLYKADCSSFTNGTLIAGSTGASFTIATAGTYIISVKYSTKSIAGTSAPTSNPVTYTFTATPPGASSSASVLLKKL